MPPAGLADLSILGGLLAGFASSLHCVGMCSGIAASLMFTLAPEASENERRIVILKAQFGRIAAYMLAGAVLGAIGSQFYFDADRAEGFTILRWAGAVTLVCIGLSVAGWAPALAGLDRVGAGLIRIAQNPLGGKLSAATPVLAGFLWGLLPCGMVYAALF
ncbi:sulfite exporter TauE/SafE family protein [Maricaulis sp. MIT060901]|uniref:sulfite exporter TauE/SafE family protein n=1 Tax=Maricaulis sp. MIT060901 TaxID=3096993 RepID=UPI00399C282A